MLVMLAHEKGLFAPSLLLANKRFSHPESAELDTATAKERTDEAEVALGAGLRT